MVHPLEKIHIRKENISNDARSQLAKLYKTDGNIIRERRSWNPLDVTIFKMLKDYDKTNYTIPGLKVLDDGWQRSMREPGLPARVFRQGNNRGEDIRVFIDANGVIHVRPNANKARNNPKSIYVRPNANMGRTRNSKQQYSFKGHVARLKKRLKNYWS